MRRMKEHLLHCIINSERNCNAKSLLFVVILPSHDTRLHSSNADDNMSSNTTKNDNNEICNIEANNKRKRSSSQTTRHCNSTKNYTSYGNSQSTEYNLIHSPYCLGHILCQAE
uniref:Uncharacterized protein n=1 Tax=Lygus hesperus TaxID=30085 RepID=A0A0A9Y5D6_LYGHE